MLTLSKLIVGGSFYEKGRKIGKKCAFVSTNRAIKKEIIIFELWSDIFGKSGLRRSILSHTLPPYIASKKYFGWPPPPLLIDPSLQLAWEE